MKRILLLTLALVPLLVSLACADNTLVLPKNLKALAVNGENASQTGTLTLPNGVNQLALRYDTSFGRGLDAETAQSEVIVALFEANNQQLRLSIPTIKKELHLKNFNRNPQIRITTAGGQNIEVQTDVLKKDGIQIFRDYEQELVKFNKSDSPAAVAPAMQTMMPALGANGQSHADAAKMLMYWYQQADPATREMFKAWIMQQN
jgi:uncharacterized protein YccT (UPF0319 family)